MSNRFQSPSAILEPPAAGARNASEGPGAPSSNGLPSDRARNASEGLPSDAPSTNRARSASEGLPAPSANGRAAAGRFVKGNEGGPGNPFGRQVAALRQRFLDAATPELFDEVFQSLLKCIRDGNVQAIKLFLSYTIGKPAKAPEPDLLDEEELDRFQAHAKVWALFPHLVNKPAPELPLELLREARPAATATHTRMLGNFFDMPAKKVDDLLDDLRHMPRDLANRKLVQRLAKSSKVSR